jgi:glycosyltransferase involved in cell wall biosynthesis
MKKVKVIHILEASLGGTRKHVFDLLNGIDLSQYDLSFCYSTLRADENFFVDLKRIRKRGIACHEIDIIRRIGIKEDIRSFLKLYKIIKRNDYDIVHCHSSKAGFLGRVAAKVANHKIKTIYTPNSLAVNVKKRYLLFEKIAGLFTDIIIAVSESERREIISSKIVAPVKVVTINSGVSIKGQEKGKLRTLLGIDKTKSIVLCVGRLTRQKNPLIFVEVANQVLAKRKDVIFVWIGDGELRGIIERRIDECNLSEQVHLLGWRMDVDELMSDADIFLLTSIYESFGYVTCEAMACGLPVVATNITGTNSIVVNGETGYLENVGDYEGLSHKITILLDAQQKRCSMGEKGRQRIKQYFSIEGMIKQTEEVYKKLCQ